MAEPQPNPPVQSTSATGRVAVVSGVVKVELKGRLDASTLPDVWREVVPQLPGKLESNLQADCTQLGYCDGAGLGLLVYLRRRAAESGVRVKFAGLKDGLRGLLERSDPGVPPKHKPPKGWIEKLGATTAEVFANLVAMVAFLGEVIMGFLWAVAHPHRVRWRDVLLIAEKAGAEAVPVVCLLGWLMGVIISFQSVPVLRGLGVESMIPMMLAIAMVRELGPLVTAIILAGRTGSAFAAELGTMKVTEEINALTTFGLDPARFLVVPRIIAAVIVTPLLSVFGTLFGLIGGYLIMATLGYGLPF